MTGGIVHYLERAKELIGARQFSESLALLNEALESTEDSEALWELKGMALYAQRDFAAAQHALEVATSLGPAGAEAQFILADCYDRLGSPLTAECICEYLTSRVKHVPLQLLPALAAKLGKWQKYHLALQVCRRAAELQPECEHAVFGVAYYMGKAGFPAEQVIPILRRVYDLAPNVTKYRWALAQALYCSGDWQAAYELMDSVEIGDVAQMCCTDCVQRLWQIFEHAGDYRRCDWCRARLQVLSESETS